MSNRLQIFRQHAANPDTFASVLLAIAIDLYGRDIFEWTPEALLLQLRDDLAVELPKLNADKLVVALDLVLSDDFYKRTRRFIQVCNVLAGAELTDEFDPADAAECAWGMTEAMLLWPPDEDEPFTDEIRRYLGKMLDLEGIREPPDLLRLAIRDTPSGDFDYSGLSLDDPAMFAAEFGVHADRAKEIREMLDEELTQLFQQLQSLPLENGNVKDLLQRIRGRLSS